MVVSKNKSRQAVLFIILCFFLWFIIDFGTAGGFKVGYFDKFGVTLLLFYFGYPIIFALLIFKLNYGGKQLFFATLIAIFIVEVIFTNNPLVMHFPWLLLGIPLAIAIYMPLTFFPLWIVRKEMTKHIWAVILLSTIEIIVILLTTFGTNK